MDCRRVLMLSCQWKVVPSLLRPHFNSNALRGSLRRCSNTSVRVERAASLFAVVSGQRTILRRTLGFVQRHWKHCITAGTLCGSGLLLTRMATAEADGLTHLNKCQTHFAQDSNATYSVHVADQSTYCEATFSQFTLPEKVYVIVRCVYLAFIFSPTVILYGMSRLFHSTNLESLAWSYTMRAVQTAGPAFVKLGQWASTRRDIFSEEFCNSLSQLHASCQSHRWKDTIRTLEEEFGREWQEILEISDPRPIGSGCVAQVYKGHLKTKAATVTSTTERGNAEEAEGQDNSLFSRLARGILRTKPTRRRAQLESSDKEQVPVAVKVLHPGTVQAMERDMLLMRYGTYWMDWLYPNFHWVALKECFSEFAIVMRKQVLFIHG